MADWYIQFIAVPLLIGALADMAFGDPAWLPHPVVAIGRLISFLEKKVRAFSGGREPGLQPGLIVGGAFIWIITLAASTLIPLGILYGAYRLSPCLCIAIESFMCFQILALGCLRRESMEVCRLLRTGDREGARQRVGYLVGRDTQSLDEAGITRACVETVAENTTDGCIAPLIYMMIGGPVAGFAYKAVNTMDSMLGYKNEKYLYLGRIPAQMDDLWNLVPARIAALLMIVAAGLTEPWLETGRGCLGRALGIFARDRKKSSSPNSGQTESVCAGALGVRLLGDASYFGIVHHKPFIGDDLRDIEARDIARANLLMHISQLLALGLWLGGVLWVYTRN